MEKVENAKIESADVTMQRGFILSVSILIKGEGWDCSYGGNYLLARADKPSETGALLAEVIAALMKCFDVNSIGKLEGLPCRVDTGGRTFAGGTIKRIGHFMKDKWVDIDKLCEPYRSADHD